ncbi:metal-dependent hydrolase [Haliea sp. E17]|uniref:metal-dependent hydrolase n=1 Tax=Haliea sp. E17 TaxID=3401576 RepID=UPI003AAEC710
MDPITQGAVGAAAAQLAARPRDFAKVALVGALGGMAPDLDIFIRSGTDPLLALEYHRQFTHSLLMIPLLGGIVGLALYGLLGRRWQLDWRQCVLWSILGYATHGLLDGCTSYGTQLLWPLSDRRFAWDSISVIDPLFTLPLLLALGFAIRRRSRPWLLAGIAWSACYLGLGFIQHERAIAMGEAIAASRGDQPLRLEAKPSFGNLVVWKVIYETADAFHVDAVKPGLGQETIWPGDSVVKLDAPRHLPWLQDNSQQWRDIQRFAHFSDGYLALDEQHAWRVVDMRYSLLPQQIQALWGIQLSPERGEEAHVDYVTQRSGSREALDQLLAMIFH